MAGEVNERRRERPDGDRCGFPEPPRWGKTLQRTLVSAFAAFGRCRFDLRVRGLENFTNQPGTLIVSNHKSDYDLILLVPLLFRAYRGRGAIGRVSFVAAEQMFDAGYLSSYVLARGPEQLRRLLYRMDLGPILRALRAHPVPASRQRRLVIHLREVLALEGNLPLEEVFRVAPRRVLPGVEAGARVADVLCWRYNRELYAHYDLAVFHPVLASKLRRRQAERALASLRDFAAVLDAGDSLFISPEGGLSGDGRSGEIKAGLGRLVRTARREPRLLPVNITYDTMTSGRPAAFVSIGRELTGVRAWPRRRLETAVREAMCALETVTLRDLAALCMRHAPGSGLVEHADASLRDRVFEQAWRLAREGRRVDPRLLDPVVFERCWSQFIEYGRRCRGLGPAIDPAAYPAAGFAPPEPTADDLPPIAPAGAGDPGAALASADPTSPPAEDGGLAR